MNLIVTLIILLVLGSSIAYIIKAKKAGAKCIGCPDSCSCGSSSNAQISCCSCSSCGCDTDN